MRRVDVQIRTQPFIVVRAALALALTGVLGGIAIDAQSATAAKPAVEKSARVGAGVYEVAVGGDTVYVASVGGRGETGTAKIYALDPKTLETKKTIPVTDAAFGLGFNAKTQRLYTSNTRTGTVSAIDLKTGNVLASISSEADPKAHTFRVLVDEDADTVYVSLASKDGKIWVIDGKTNTIAHTIANVGVTPTGLALDKAANRLYAAVQGTNDIAAIDLKTREVVTRFPAGGERPTQMAFDAKTSRLFVTSQTGGSVSAINTKSGELLKTIKTGAQALGIGFNPATNRVYVANRQGGTVTVIDATSYEILADLPAGSLPNTVAVDYKTNSVYVTNNAKSGGRGAPPVDDPNGDTVTLIR